MASIPHFTAQRVERALSAAMILRIIGARPRMRVTLHTLARGIEIALTNDDIDHFVMVKQSIRELRGGLENHNESEPRNIAVALLGVLDLLAPAIFRNIRHSDNFI